MRTTALWMVALVVMTVGWGCAAPTAPSPLVGDWTGRIAPTHFQYLDIRFTDAGGQGSGVACMREFDVVYFTDVPVTVRRNGSLVMLTLPDGRTTYSGHLEGGVLRLQSNISSADYVELTPGGRYCSP